MLCVGSSHQPYLPAEVQSGAHIVIIQVVSTWKLEPGQNWQLARNLKSNIRSLVYKMFVLLKIERDLQSHFIRSPLSGFLFLLCNTSLHIKPSTDCLQRQSFHSLTHHGESNLILSLRHPLPWYQPFTVSGGDVNPSHTATIRRTD